MILKKNIEILAFDDGIHKREDLLHLSADPNTSRTIYFHAIHTAKDDLRDVLHHLSLYSAIPESLRLAHVIASTVKINIKNGS